MQLIQKYFSPPVTYNIRHIRLKVYQPKGAAHVPLNVTLQGQKVKCSTQVRAWAFNTKKITLATSSYIGISRPNNTE